VIGGLAELVDDGTEAGADAVPVLALGRVSEPEYINKVGHRIIDLPGIVSHCFDKVLDVGDLAEKLNVCFLLLLKAVNTGDDSRVDVLKGLLNDGSQFTVRPGPDLRGDLAHRVGYP
jgi:hypothetical protein